jgi:hypothetical protein
LSIAFELAMMLHIAAAIAATGRCWPTPRFARPVPCPLQHACNLRLTLPALTLVGILGFGVMGLSDDTFGFDQP